MLRGRVKRIAGVGAGVVAILAVAVTPVSALAPPSGWNGANPFVCELQNVGFGTAFPHPDADPFCVEFDKRHQNVSQLGVVDFLSQEPVRVAAASPKCFYFQSDHWRGSVVQDDPSTKTYEWDGHYFFDKASGEGGVWVTNFNFNGQTYDPSAIPGMPPQYARFFGPGTGGFVTHDQVPADPRCVALAQQDPRRIYGSSRPRVNCSAPSGEIGSRRLGRVQIGDRESRVRELLGDPPQVRRGFLRYCLADGRSFLVGQAGDRSGAFGGAGSGTVPTAFLYSDSPAFRWHGVGPGTSERLLRRRWRHARQRLRMSPGVRVLSQTPHGTVLVGLRAGRVRWIAVNDRRTVGSAGMLRSYLRRTTPD